MDPKCSTTLVLFATLKEDDHFSMPRPKRASVFTDTRPNSTTNCWQILYFVLVKRVAPPHPHSRIRSFDRDIKSTLKTMSLEVDSAVTQTPH